MHRRLDWKWISTRLESDRNAYRAACRRVNTFINRSQFDFFPQQLHTATNCKQRWRIAKKLLHWGSTTNDTVGSLSCQTVANYFVDKISTLKRAVAATLGNLTLVCLPDCQYTGLPRATIVPLDAAFVYRHITALKSSGSSVNFVPTSLLKLCPGVFAELICTLANLSFAKGVFPEIFKLAIVTPLLKKPGLDQSMPSSYRTISRAAR
jgi:hypothetical protein